MESYAKLSMDENPYCKLQTKKAHKRFHFDVRDDLLGANPRQFLLPDIHLPQVVVENVKKVDPLPPPKRKRNTVQDVPYK